MQESAYIAVRDLSWLQIALKALGEVRDIDGDLLEAYRITQAKMDQIYDRLDVRE